jgi:hypothetical protein
VQPVERFLHLEAGSAALLMAAAVVCMARLTFRRGASIVPLVGGAASTGRVQLVESA